jgi:hypothetical protein
VVCFVLIRDKKPMNNKKYIYIKLQHPRKRVLSVLRAGPRQRAESSGLGRKPTGGGVRAFGLGMS